MYIVVDRFAELAIHRTAIVVSWRISFVGFAVYHNAVFLLTCFPPLGKSGLSVTGRSAKGSFRHTAFVLASNKIGLHVREPNTRIILINERTLHQKNIKFAKIISFKVAPI